MKIKVKPPYDHKTNLLPFKFSVTTSQTSTFPSKPHDTSSENCLLLITNTSRHTSECFDKKSVFSNLKSDCFSVLIFHTSIFFVVPVANNFISLSLSLLIESKTLIFVYICGIICIPIYSTDSIDIFDLPWSKSNSIQKSDRNNIITSWLEIKDMSKILTSVFFFILFWNWRSSEVFKIIRFVNGIYNLNKTEKKTKKQ